MALLLGIYLFGLFEAAVLPPFEGFDEPGHYSYIQQLAWTGTWPRHGDPMSADVDRYLAVAPTAAAMSPPWSYRAFFAAPPEVIGVGRREVHGAPPEPRAWRPGHIANWEAQHPPLYYALLAPVFRWSAGWSLGAQLLLLRSVSYTLAWLGLALASLGAIRRAHRGSPPSAAVVLAPALWTLIFPMWFPEMARLGNDSLVVVFAAAMALLSGKLIDEEGSLALHLGIGGFLGLGLLTKATFLPLTLAIMTLLARRCWRRRQCPEGRRMFGKLVACASVCAGIAGWWYVLQAVQTGSPIGSNDAIHLGDGLGEGLRRHGSLVALLRMPAAFELSMVWPATWSAVFPPLVTVLPPLIGPVILAAAAASDMRKRRLAFDDGVAMVTLVLFVSALAYHSLILIAETGSVAPAWYLQSFAPVLWPLLAWGLAAALARRRIAWVAHVSLLYALPFLLFVTVLQLLFLAGCAGLRADTRRFDLAGSRACLADPGTVFHNLDVIAFPSWGAIVLAAAAVLLTTGCVSARAALVASPPSPGGQRVSQKRHDP